jgi:hypothetical protein
VKLANELRSNQIVPTFELSNAVLDLFAAALSEQLGCESSVRPETRRHALILQIKAFIDARLDDPELTTMSTARLRRCTDGAAMSPTAGAPAAASGRSARACR